MLRVGVDIGGTFTDLVSYDETTGTISKLKVPTTPDRPDQGLLDALQLAAIRSEDLGYFVHGTTLVTNLVLERSGAKVGVITTKGFRDVLLIQTGQRAGNYDIQWERRQPLVPRHLIVEVAERVDTRGNVLTPVDLDEVAEGVRHLVDHGVESIAVCLFNAYINGEHEQAVGARIRETAPGLPVSLSSEVDPRVREYPRVSTTVLNAYSMPKVGRYLERLDQAVGANKEIKLMHSGGGVMPSSVAREMPIMLVASGPAAGALAGTYIGEHLGIDDIITADMGGTSFDVSLIRNGIPEIKETTDVEFAIPLRTDSIDVTSIGAGGGSIAWIDEGGALRVGPQSAGAAPGPACYNLGGTQPTVTDANMVLGLLNPDNLLGGRLPVKPQNARDAIEPIAEHFQMSTLEAALGIYRITNAHLAQAIRQITVKKGIDPRDFTLLPFGGAGGQHAIEVAKELDITSVLFPVNASTLSAMGMLTASLKNTQSATLWASIDDLNMVDLQSTFEELAARSMELLSDEESWLTNVTVDWSADIRYIGQSYEVRVPLAAGELSAQRISDAFDRIYRERHGMVLGDPIEIVNVHAAAEGHITPFELPELAEPTGIEPKPTLFRQAALYDDELPVYDRLSLERGTTLEGPCIIEEIDSTIFVPDACELRVDSYGNIVATITAPPSQDGIGEAADGFDPFTAEIISSYLVSTVDEMVSSTTAAAYSLTFSERLDFTCAIFDPKGRMVAQALGVPVHAGSMFDSVSAVLDTFGDTLKEGDAILLNDVYQGGSHQPDVLVVRPVFDDDRLIALAANRGHWTDIGGMAAGGWTGTAQHVVQEGLTIPPCKLYDGGVLDTTIRDFILRNVRLPKQIWGDIQSQISANITAERRLKSLIEKYGLKLVLAGFEHTLDYGRRRFRQKLLELPDGEGTDYDILDTDGITDKRYRIQASIRKEGDRVYVDCTGSSEQAYAVINVSLVYAKAAIYTGIMSLVDPDGVLNSGSLEMIEIFVPEGTILHPQYPAPVAAGAYATSGVLGECVVRAFADLLPERVIASSHGDRENTTLSGYLPETGEEWIWYSSHNGGYGARATKDGESIGNHMGFNGRIASLEMLERQFPVRFHGWEMMTDSGGAGTYRGGLAGRLEVELLTDALVTAAATRHIVPGRGIFGGRDGAIHAFRVTRDGTTRTMQEMFDLPSPSKFTNLPLLAGDRFTWETGGGGGYGPAHDRDPARVEADVRAGLVSIPKARDEYGVDIDPATGAHDREATRTLRQTDNGAGEDLG